MNNLKEQEPLETPNIITQQWTNTARYIVAVMFVFALLGLFIFISPIARTLAAALLFAIVFDIPIRYLVRRSAMTYRKSALAVYLVVYVCLALLLFVGWKLAVNYLQGMITDLSQAATALLTTLQGSSSGSATATQSIGAVTTEGLAKILAAMVKTLLGILSAPVITYARFAFVVVNVGLFVFISNLLVFSAHGARGGLRKWVPDILDREAKILVTYFDRIWGNYLAGMAFFVLLLGAGSIVEYWLLGVPYPVVFGVLTGLICLLPLIGGFLSGLVVFIPCLLLGSTRFAELDPLVFALIVTLINDVICTIAYNFGALPVIGKLVRLPYWVTFAGVLLGFAFNNILLAFLIIPLFSTMRIVYTYFLAKIIGREPFPGVEKPVGPAKGFLSQFLLDDPVKRPGVSSEKSEQPQPEINVSN
jgi:predicted PurR-regulated permease PerM